jgi:transposase InsO family protein
VQTITDIQADVDVTAKAACLAAGVPYSTFKRWNSRLEEGLPPVSKPGPGPNVPLDEDEIHRRILELHHGRKRTHGTGELYDEFSERISRRDLQDMVRDARDAANAAERDATTHLEWFKPGSAWASDTTEVDVAGYHCHVQTIRDLASRYTITPYANHNLTCKEVAAMLEKAFKAYGAPLILKLDNGAYENGKEVLDLLAKWGVILLNSPVYYPQYNGSVERAQQEIQDELAAALIPALAPSDDVQAHVTAHVAVATNALNHKLRDTLKGKCACTVFNHERSRGIVTRSQRKEILTDIVIIAATIISYLDEPTRDQTCKAFRLATEQWLLSNNYIVVKPGSLSPSSSPL